MKLTNLKRANEYEVRKWLEETLNLSAYQKEKLHYSETIRFSPFYFYKREKEPRASFLWRLTIVAYPVYITLLVLFMPIKWMGTGKWGYGRGFIDKFHSKWVRKLGL